MIPTIAPLRANAARHATDDEILGITSAHRRAAPALTPEQFALEFDAQSSAAGGTVADRSDESPTGFDPAKNDRRAQHAVPLPEHESTADAAIAEPEELRGVFEANPGVRRAWHDAQAYREAFATPEEARNATALLADLDRMDALFFSRRPEDHAELARAVAALDPAAFASLAHAMNGLAANSVGAQDAVPGAALRTDHDVHGAGGTGTVATGVDASAGGFDPAKDDRWGQHPVPLQNQTPAIAVSPTPAQTEFFHATNAAAVEGVIGAIESQVERLLPEGVSRSARQRVVGEIYRELDTTLRANRQLSQQMRDAFRAGALDAGHQRAIVSLVTARARQALPGVAKRVMNEWTSTLVAANQERRARQRTAERRVDIAGSSGSGSDARRSLGPRDIDYARMSDADILNM
jgi:HPt (histidine-containing phosphotransfer) domain-containing protein